MYPICFLEKYKKKQNIKYKIIYPQSTHISMKPKMHLYKKNPKKTVINAKHKNRCKRGDDESVKERIIDRYLLIDAYETT